MYFARRNFIISLSILLLIPLNKLVNQMNNKLPAEIFKHWIHSREEDMGDVRVYRPSDYQFPPSRGREGFEIKPNGQFIRYGIGSTDKPQKKMGTWKAQGENQIRVFFDAQRQTSYTMQILSCDESVLKVRLVQ